ncbi:MAG: hypothetical protein F4X02_08110 [Chloroflexi bacterium]|nr:hypothetical protein [Chloroflexota bacterium]
MRRLMIVLVVLMSFAPALQAQSQGFPLCSASELAYVAELQPVYDDLVASLSADGDTSLDKTLVFTQAQIEWREPLWDGLPRCAEAIDIAVLMSQNTSDMGGMAALTYAGVSLSLNRYKDRLFFEGSNTKLLASMFEQVKQLIESGERPADPAAGDRELEDCSEDQVRTLIAELRENEDLIVQGTSVQAPGDLMDYISAKLEWRDQVWARLPACRESIGVGRNMSQTASDLATAIAFSYAQVPGPENPFAATLSDDLTLLGDLLVFLISSIGEQVAADLESPLPACAAVDKAAVAEMLSSFDALVEPVFGIETTEDLLAYIEQLIDWRSELWSGVPFCAEAVEISLLAANTALDFATFRALQLSGESADLNLLVDTAIAGLLKVAAFAADNQASNPATTAASQADSLPACAESAKPSLLGMRDQSAIFYSLTSGFLTVEELANVAEVHIHWREQIWKEFPPCQEAIKAGRLLIQLTGDLTPSVALLFHLDVPWEDNPFIGETSTAREQLLSYVTMFGDE